MPRIMFVSPDGERRVVDAASGDSVMVAAITSGIDGILAECGGALACGTCHVYVHPEWLPLLPEPGDGEQAMLDGTAAPRRRTSRLCCQIIVTEAMDGLVLELPTHQD